MLTVDLSTLGSQELRRLLDTTRQRGQAKLSYEILQEMAARREQGEGRRSFGRIGSRRADSPHEIRLDLGDPLDRMEDEPGDEDLVQMGEVFVDEPLEAADVTPNWEPDEPTYLHSDEPARPARMPPPDRPPRGFPVPRRWVWVTVGIAIGLFVGLAVGGWADGISREPRLPGSKQPDTTQVAVAALPPANALPPATAQLEPSAPIPSVAAADDTITPATAPPPAATTPPPANALPPTTSQATPALTPAKPAAPATPPAPAVALAPQPAAKPKVPASPATPKAVPPKAAPKDAIDLALENALASPDGDAEAAPAKPVKATAKGACAAAATPADKTICETPRLQQLQRDLRTAYADALDAHQDRALLREHELAWRASRSAVTDPDRLARLYQERIRKLNAAAAEARAAAQ